MAIKVVMLAQLSDKKMREAGGLGEAQKATILLGLDPYMQLWKITFSVDPEKLPRLTKRIWATKSQGPQFSHLASK